MYIRCHQDFFTPYILCQDCIRDISKWGAFVDIGSLCVKAVRIFKKLLKNDGFHAHYFSFFKQKGTLRLRLLIFLADHGADYVRHH